MDNIRKRLALQSLQLNLILNVLMHISVLLMYVCHSVAMKMQ